MDSIVSLVGSVPGLVDSLVASALSLVDRSLGIQNLFISPAPLHSV